MVTSHPAIVEWLSWGVSALRNVGLAAVLLVWGLVSVVILAVPRLLSLALGTLGRGAGSCARTDGVAAAGPAWPPTSRVRAIAM